MYSNPWTVFKRLKSNMDRFIGRNQLFGVQTLQSLKSNMDRFIGLKVLSYLKSK